MYIHIQSTHTEYITHLDNARPGDADEIDVTAVTTVTTVTRTLRVICHSMH